MDLFPIPKINFADEIAIGTDVEDVFLLDSISARPMKKGGNYWSVTLRDRTGEVPGKIWKESSFVDGIPSAGTYVKVRALAEQAYKKPEGDVELNISKVRAVQGTEGIALEDFIPVGPNDRFTEMESLINRIDRYVDHPGLNAICRYVTDDPLLHMSFRDAPAAKGMHQPYIGGLLDHVRNLIACILGVCKVYISPDRGLLITAAIWHDIGKTREYEWERAIRTTREGRLVGHVLIGMEMLDRVKPIFMEATCPSGSLPVVLDDANELWDHLRHIVASHHGRLEWGAAKLPCSREALIFHIVDLLDSRMGALDIAEKETLDRDGFTPWMRAFEGEIWKPKLQELN